MTQEMRDNWSDIIGRLFCMESLPLLLSHEAERLYADYADANDMKADAEEDDYIGGVRQKMNIHVLRLAIMAHLLSEHWNEPVVTGECMEYAIRIADYCRYELFPNAIRLACNWKRTSDSLRFASP